MPRTRLKTRGLKIHDGGKTIVDVPSARFWHFRWPYGHAGQWVRLPAWGFLLVFYSNHGPKMHRFELGAWDGQRRTSRRTSATLLNAPVWGKTITTHTHARTHARTHTHTHTHTQRFNGPLSGTTWVGQYEKKHSPTQTHPVHQTSFINFLHLLQSIASSLFNLSAWQSFSTTSL